MSNAPYSEDIARIYDLLVEGREDAEADGEELEFLLWALRDVCPRPVRDVLDAGCGTGRHVIPLAQEGLAVTAADRSPAMLAECRRKLEARGLRAQFAAADAAALPWQEAFDAALCMHCVLCYLPTTEHLLEALDGLRRALRPGGLLVLDNANLLAQHATFGRSYEQERRGPTMRLIFREERAYEDFASVLHIRIEGTAHAEKGSFDFRNEDVLRVMTANEMTVYLKEAGFTGISAYPSFDRDRADEASGERIILLALRPEGP
jgi:SAM-dependent methyltransferase